MKSRPKIYFSGAIRGGRGDREIYRRMISHLSRHGTVLTEHIGDDELTEDGEFGMSDGQIFGRDLAWLRDADVFVAEVTTPSLGVGYEIGVAESLGTPILCLFRAGSGRRLSAMVSGNGAATVGRYEDWDEAARRIDDFFASLS